MLWNEKLKLCRKSRQNAENKQTFVLTGKIEINEKTRQNAENKQTCDLPGKNWYVLYVKGAVFVLLAYDRLICQ